MTSSAVTTELPAAGPASVDDWNGWAGDGWIDLQKTLDAMFAPQRDFLLAQLREDDRRKVLDIGCGTGATSLALSARLADGGHCTGIDISGPMVMLARKRLSSTPLPVDFVVADAATHPFKAGHYELLVSRFGVMFFPDPKQAFSNLLRAAAPGAELHALAWRRPEDNPFMTIAGRAASSVLPELKPPPPNEPGQFGFADSDWVQGILGNSGWGQVRMNALNFACAFPADQLAGFVTKLGALGRRWPDLDKATRAALLEAVLPAYEPHIGGDKVHFTAACWHISAKAPR
ncbi:MAG: class I SAM-dependent methyltransferase [Pseudomonadota bacterium]